MKAQSSKVIGCCPASKEAQDALGVVYTPTPAHVQVPCQHCGEGCFIGPHQLALYQSDPVDYAIMCFLCLKVLMTQPPEIYHLGGSSGEYKPLEDQ